MMNFHNIILIIVLMSYSCDLLAKTDVVRDFIIRQASREQLYDASSVSPLSSPFYISNDEKKLFLVLGSGNAKSDMYDFKLLMYETSEINDYLTYSNYLMPDPILISSTQYDRGSFVLNYHEQSGIKNVFFDELNKIVYFIQNDKADIFQVYSYNLQNKKKHQLTNSKLHVLDYAVIKNSNSLIYTTGYKEKLDDCSKNGFRVGTRLHGWVTCLRDGTSLFNNNAQDQAYSLTLKLNLISLNSNRDVITLTQDVRIDEPLRLINLSPDGNYVILKLKKNEQVVDSSRSQLVGGVSNRTAFKLYDPMINSPWPIFEYYALIDVRKKILKIISVSNAKNFGTDYDLVWVDHNTIGLPVNTTEKYGENRDSYLKNSRFSGYKFYNIEDILSHPESEWKAISYNSKAEIKKYLRKNNIEFNSCPITNHGFKQAEGNSSCYAEIKKYGIRIETGESFDTPPGIFVYKTRLGIRKVLYSLNRNLANEVFGKVKLLQWSDDTGRSWQAGLVFPPDYSAGKRYPIVIQTHGFDPNKFLLNGPAFSTAPYAAQALARRGIVVLQMPNFDSKKLADRHPTLARGINSAISILDKKRIIDTDKIGIVGFSALGAFVFDMIVFPKYNIKAALIADAYSPSPFGYSSLFGASVPGMLNHELMACGAQPWGSSQADWIKRNPYFHLDRMNTPLLIKEYSSYLSGWWDIYAGLKRLHKPVDFFVFTTGGHPPSRLNTIVNSQILTVQWFDFWLNGGVGDYIYDDNLSAWKDMRKSMRLENNLSKRSLQDMDCGNVDLLEM